MLIVRLSISLLISVFLSLSSFSQPTANFVNNGSFEAIYSCAGPLFPLNIVKYWSSIDTTSFSALYYSTCNNRVPLYGNKFQFPFKGNSFIITTAFCPNFCNRGYPRNRLKSTLVSGKIYCVKFYVNITNPSPYGIDGFGAYFGNNGVDTITQCNIPLSYLTPQIQNPTGNVILDTLNWVPISGTFTAVGDEKYMLLGNFLADNAVATASIGGPFYPQLWTDVLFDYASCIDVDLDAYAGPDKNVILGDSVYIGRESDVEIDESCTWYKMTSPTTSVTIDTIAGMWVKPAVTSTYVVRQQLWCSGVKWDTVVVSLSGVGLSELEAIQNDIQLIPNPATDFIQIRYSLDISSKFEEISIFYQLGQLISKQKLIFSDKKVVIPISELNTGVYFLELRSVSNLKFRKRFVVSR